MKKLVLLGLLCLFFIGGKAQEKVFVRHYKGSVEVDGGLGFNYTSGTIPIESGNKLGVTTIHGIQLSPNTFLGVGMGYSYHHQDKKAFLPVLANFRVNANWWKVSPYIDLRGGYSFIDTKDYTFMDMKGSYISLGIGVSYPLCRSLALTGAVAYEEQGFTIKNFGQHELKHLGLRIGLTF